MVRVAAYIVVALILFMTPVHGGETTLIPARHLPLNSTGSSDDGDVHLRGNGYVGTYIRVERPGSVKVSVNASGSKQPTLQIALGKELVTHTVADQAAEYALAVTLAAGTYVLRVQANDAQEVESRVLTIRSVQIDGATWLPDNTDANALLAADTWINEFRRGRAVVAVPGAREGDRVHVKLVRHAFNFGGVCSGTETNKYFFDDPEPGSDAARVQEFITANFNAVVPGNAGKWGHNEAERGTVTMDLADAITAFARRHGLRVRMHTLLWDTNQQPPWVSDLLGKALAGDASAKAELRQAVQKRMEYYLVQRGRHYCEIDGLNENYHRPRWWQVFGAEGIAEIYTAAAEAVRRGGGDALIFTNEYNVLQWSSHPLKGGGPDPYANWYRDYVEQLVRAGGAVGGIGMQYYARNSDSERRGNPHSPARMMQVFQNLAITGLPMALTEFGIQSVGNPTPTESADILEDTVRMAFGMPGMTGFVIWGFWEKEMWDQADRAALVDAQWRLTPAGRRWKALMSEWDTDLHIPADATGRVAFTGFFGDYELKLGDRIFRLELRPDKQSYEAN